MHFTRQFVIIAGLFCCSLILFTWGIGSQEVIGFESRFYLFAQEMWRNGASWFPTTYQQPYPDYPGLATFLIYLTARVAGTLNKFVAVFPSAVAAALTVVMTYAIGALRSQRWGLCAVWLLLMTVTFFKSSRSVTLDMYPALMTTACFYLVYVADVQTKPQWRWWIYPLLALSFAFRGPIGLVMPAGVVCSYYFVQRRFRTLLVTGCLALIVLLICSSVLVWLAYRTGGYAFMQDVLRMEVLGRLGESHLPFYYYLQTALTDYAVAFPLALLVILGVIWRLPTTLDKQFIWQLIAWFAVILLGMSIPGDKKIRYILPLAPAAALLAAYPFVIAVRQTYFTWLRNMMLGMFFLLPGLVWLAGKLMVPQAVPLVFLLLQIINIGLLYLPGRFTMYRSMLIMGMAVCTFVITFIIVVEPLTLFVERARALVVQIEQQRQQAGAALVFYKEGRDGLPIKYLINTDQASAQFIDDEQALLAQPKPAFFVTRATQFMSLPTPIQHQFRIIAKDSLGHVTIVVFTRK